MPELPEVEVIRQGLAQAIVGTRVSGVEVRDPRALKRHRPRADADAFPSSAADFASRLEGQQFAAPLRRGKFLWIPLVAEPGVVFLAHLGMSGQLLLRTADQPDDRHVRVRLWLEHDQYGELRLDFCDQRLFGSLALDPLSDVQGSALPSQIVHIAPDPLDPLFDAAACIAQLRRRTQAIKSVLLAQHVVSGIGNIYADEALWLARVHPETPGREVSVVKAKRLIVAVQEVFQQALAAGGTSFDQLYVRVNGESGYFSRSLHAYGRTGQPCHRCGTPITRVPFAGRSSHFCPRCQRRR